MGLPSGTGLGPYEILAPLGVWGKGEVFRAREGAGRTAWSSTLADPGPLARKAGTRAQLAAGEGGGKDEPQKQGPARGRPSGDSGADGASAGLREALCREFPVHQLLEERGDVVGAAVLPVEVVGALPDVNREEGLRRRGQGRLGVRRLGALQLAAVEDEPRPAAPELRGPRRRELLLEVLE